ncbi:Exodeoxyribonuclease VII small subunit [Trichormus variabilis ATCC 29413]|uniref:Exodeoxyribonuclease 7 small subunit n=2 Tax=Anabaena variabilis TaxID=264691 RepID=EX7S_TRIV2|nr:MULTISPECIES: exodeoxyribonuclease VII small subunit [Nostocaceae]Q3MGJ7.1 RecName: Full=Exodeoxyribonuclease 7 small subunit; AltName: Full=Exodeoxyribonuclease VII small subunit; Short=Exonuclease VII small subunit [Trichormus variabilis ATCC 29413]ABA19889.1 Exodeoxyribonuclease VII small subunit [Trichormus variabilis ATCC 29413]MBC1216138.1 exodeoxyribonuclease VII small subunit [Trichormus variabilis ARAD]MBC1258596.1 exodeoxyribonuclease VII small subunit [Trichormus variabilis V5]MB
MVKRKNSDNSGTVAQGNYEAKVAEIEAIISRIESGELELETVFEQFANAVQYLRQCDTFLQQRQQQIDLLIETLNEQDGDQIPRVSNDGIEPKK